MHKGKTYTNNQDRRSLAALSVVVLCLKTLLPFITALFISHTASAQNPLPQVDRYFLESEQEITASLQVICTPTGTLLIESSDNASSNSNFGHCDHCTICNFISLNHTAYQAGASHSKTSLSAWHITDQNKNLIVQGYSIAASRAPPTV